MGSTYSTLSKYINKVSNLLRKVAILSNEQIGFSSTQGAEIKISIR